MTPNKADHTPLLEVTSLNKHYGHIRALNNVSLSIYPGQVVGLVGDNGAGKSTLVNLLSGTLQPSGGHILMDGVEVAFPSPAAARQHGIETVYQDLALAPELPIWLNFFLGRERLARPPLQWIGWMNRKQMTSETETGLKHTKIRISSVRRRANQLSGGQRQAIAVARAMAWGARLILMDEPTGALGVEQQATVAELIHHAASSGAAVLLISHNLPQVHSLCKRIFVLYHGHLVTTLDASRTTIEDTVRWITGAALQPSQLTGLYNAR